MRGLSGEEGLRGRAEESEEGAEAGVCEDGVEKEEVRGHLSSNIPMKKAACATPFLDGDLNLLAFEDGKPVVKGIPWCGTSGIFTTETYPLGGIILLARDKKNHVEELSYQNQVLGIQMRFISPKWNAKQTAESLDFAERIAKSARIARLYCNMEDEAAEVCRAWIDNGKS